MTRDLLSCIALASSLLALGCPSDDDDGTGDTAADTGGASDTGDTGDTSDVPEPLADVQIQEVLVTPAVGAAGDANCDGTSDVEDAFVELANLGDAIADLGGATLTVSGGTLVFPAGTLLAPGESLVVFGDQTTPRTATEPWCAALDGVGVTTLVGLPSMATVDTVMLDSVAGVRIAAIVATPGESTTRSPEQGGPFVPHTTVSANPQSPGATNGGGAYADL